MLRPRPVTTRRRLPQAVAITSWTVLLAACGGSSTSNTYTSGPSPPSTYTIAVNVSGLSGTGLVLQLNGGGDLAITTNGAATFPTALASGNTYTVTVSAQPTQPAQTCSVSGGSGTVGMTDVSGIAVTCVTAMPTPATVTTVYSFTGNASGGSGTAPNGSLVQGQDGGLYGTTAGTVFRITTAGEETTLYSFPPFANANYVGGTAAGLILANDGNFYGTTQGNGVGNDISGTVYRITPTGTVSTIHTFSGPDLGDLFMSSGVIQGQDGLLYGIAFASNIFSMTTAGTDLTETPIVGYTTQASLIQTRDGTLYGTTNGGGPNVQGEFGTGTAFKSVPGSGTVTTIYIFKGAFGGPPGDPAAPVFPLIEGADGNLYGTTAYGGNPSDACPPGCGTVFKITPAGVETALYSFGASPTDGQSPSGALVLASDGNFYGTTLAGGSPNANCKAATGCGTLYRITPSGTLTVLYSFGTNAGDGAEPSGALLQAGDGNLYGTTVSGGSMNAGTVFKLTLAP
jgi:uncharacterized repeat protein (TIGR03803 family)